MVALDADELERLRELERRAEANGVPGLRWLSGDELREVEPHAAGVAACTRRTTAITDYRAVARALRRRRGRQRAAEVRLGAEVDAVRGETGRPCA